MGRGVSAATQAIIKASVEILKGNNPLSVRGLCYRLFTQKLIDGMSKGNTNKIGELMVKARMQGLVLWHWITDDTRAPERKTLWQSPDHIMSAIVSSYTRDHWQDQPYRLEIWAEKSTIKGALEEVLDRFAVTFRSFHGFPSCTALHDISEESNSSEKPMFVGYLGDFDPSGMSMSSDDIPKRLAEFGATVNFERIALTSADIADPKLPSFPAKTKKSDSRYDEFVRQFGHKCWELDALSAQRLSACVEKFILKHVDMASWEQSLELERTQKARMQRFLNGWKDFEK